MVQNPVRLEIATLASTEVLAALHAGIFDKEEQVWKAKSFAELLAMPGARAWLALDVATGQPLGLGLVRFAADEGEIITIGVLPEARRCRVGQLILDEIISQADHLGAELLLEVAANNDAARLLYEKNDFVEAGRRKDYYRRGNDARIDALVLKRVKSV